MVQLLFQIPFVLKNDCKIYRRVNLFHKFRSLGVRLSQTIEKGNYRNLRNERKLVFTLALVTSCRPAEVTRVVLSLSPKRSIIIRAF